MPAGEVKERRMVPASVDDARELIDSARLLRLLEEGGESLSPAVVPKIARMPDGIEVVEHRMGHAVGQWILEVHCDCGRRWFEVEEIDTAHCPRCGSLVRIEISGRHMAR